MVTRTITEVEQGAEETRCECGQLIAKLRQGGIELKCKRCKRIVLIPFTSIEGWTAGPLHLNVVNVPERRHSDNT